MSYAIIKPPKNGLDLTLSPVSIIQTGKIQPRLAKQSGQRGHISIFCVFSTHIIWLKLKNPTFIVHMRWILQKYQQSMLLKMSLFIKDTFQQAAIISDHMNTYGKIYGL